MRQQLNRLFQHQTLSRQEARDVLIEIAEQQHNDCLVASFLTVFRMRSITVEEMRGFRDAMLELCRPIDVSEWSPMDLCGTGGDGKDTFNISTLTAFVVAGAGIAVAKHGNNGVSSVCGSSNVLAHLGVQFTNDEDTLKRCLDRANICYLHAPLFHPAMKHVAPVRRAMGVRTFFNMLGPLVNPARLKCQIVGVFNLELARLYAYLFQLDEHRYTVVHSLDGYDEISLTGPVKLISNQGEEIVEPSAWGFSRVQPEALFGGADVSTAAQIFTSILCGEGTAAQESVVLANAAIAIRTARPHCSFSDARALAEESLRSQRALQALEILISTSQVNHSNGE